jgi:flagella basal body P-ring formation protein FlgA
MRIPMLFVIVLASISLFGCSGCMTGQNSRNVLAAKHDLLAGTVVQDDDVVMVKISPTQVTPDIPRKYSQVIGHKAIRTIPGGELIHLSQITP